MIAFSHLELLFSKCPLRGAEQMALDELLLKNISVPTLRLYCWDRTDGGCVTFGCFQSFNAVAALFPGRELVRRWSGGGIVNHQSDMTFSLIIPKNDPVSSLAPKKFYHQFHQLFLEELLTWESQQFNLQAPLNQSTTRSQQQDIPLQVCFEQPSPDDLILKGKKILGGAQRRSQGGFLHQASLEWRPSSISSSNSSWQETLLTQFANRLLTPLGKLTFKKEEEFFTPRLEVEFQECVEGRYKNQKWMYRR